MLRRHLAFAALALLTFAFVTTPAHADTPVPDADVPQVEKPHDDLLVIAGAGYIAEPAARRKTGGTLTLTGLRQKGWLAYGGTFEYSGMLFDYESFTVAPMVGAFLDSPRWLRVGVAATAGVHAYSGVGSGLLTSDPGASAVTPFVGGRIFLGGEIGGAARLHLGLQLALDDDIGRVRRTYTFEQSSWGGEPYTETATQTVGALRMGVLFGLGGAFDL